MITGIVYDDNFLVHKCLWDENYSENPQRYTSILDRCNSLGLIDRCVRIETRQATKDELLSKHTTEHIELLKSTESYNDIELEQLSSKYDSVYIHPFTYKQSLLAVGSSIELVKAIVDGRIQNGMALIRPPGHHAMKSEYCGYCFFNNVAIATQYLLGTMAVQKILIVDWDIHHGQATQQMFYDDPRVLYFSIHRYEHGKFWPNLRESDFDYIGKGNGIGFNVNVPLNKTGMKNTDYMAIIHYLLIPLAIEFSPELIIISSGYDSAIGDPKGEMSMTPACYAHIIQQLMSLAHGKVVVILEGGYYYKSLAESAALTLRALLGDPCPIIESLKQPCKSVMETIYNVIHVHKSYWDCFKYNMLCKENLPEIYYNFYDKKPEKYLTRNMYPKIDTLSFDKILNNLIKDTKLLKPQIKMGLIFKTIDHSSINIDKNDIYQYLNLQLGHIHILRQRQSTIEELNLVYANNYINTIFNQQICNDNEQSTTKIYNDSFENNLIFQAFCFSVGSVLKIVDSIVNNEIGCGISVSLPITNMIKNENMCFLNVSIISANYAIKKYFFKRILIVEMNENILQTYSNDQILIISIHRCLNSFNNAMLGNNANINNINISWSKEKINDAEFTILMQYLILPIAYEYNPELIIVSTKFYSNMDNINDLQISPTIYGYLIQWLSTLANGRLIICENDAQNNSMNKKECLLECSKALLGKPLTKLCVTKLLNMETKEIINSLVKNYINNWKSLQI